MLMLWGDAPKYPAVFPLARSFRRLAVRDGNIPSKGTMAKAAKELENVRAKLVDGLKLKDA
jgi:hypothetical protein